MVWKLVISFVTQFGAALAAWHAYQKLATDDKTRALVKAQMGRLWVIAFLLFVSNAYLIHGEYSEKEDAKRVASTNAELLRIERLNDREILRGEIRRLVRLDYTREKPSLDLRYPRGYAILSLLGTELSPQVTTYPASFLSVDWSSAKLKSITEDQVSLQFPTMYLTGGLVRHDDLNFPRQEGFRRPFLDNGPGGIEVWFEVLRDHPMGVILVVGFRDAVK